MAQQCKLGPAKHGALDLLELMHLSFHGPIAVDLRESCHHRIFVLEDADDKALEFGDSFLPDGSNFRIKNFPLAKRVHGTFDIDTFIDNDVNPGVLGEAWKHVSDLEWLCFLPTHELFLSDLPAHCNHLLDFIPARAAWITRRTVS